MKPRNRKTTRGDMSAEPQTQEGARRWRWRQKRRTGIAVVHKLENKKARPCMGNVRRRGRRRGQRSRSTSLPRWGLRMGKERGTGGQTHAQRAHGIPLPHMIQGLRLRLSRLARPRHALRPRPQRMKREHGGGADRRRLLAAKPHHHKPCWAHAIEVNGKPEPPGTRAHDAPGWGVVSTPLLQRGHARHAREPGGRAHAKQQQQQQPKPCGRPPPHRAGARHDSPCTCSQPARLPLAQSKKASVDNKLAPLNAAHTADKQHNSTAVTLLAVGEADKLEQILKRRVVRVVPGRRAGNESGGRWHR